MKWSGFKQSFPVLLICVYTLKTVRERTIQFHFNSSKVIFKQEKKEWNTKCFKTFFPNSYFANTLVLGCHVTIICSLLVFSDNLSFVSEQRTILQLNQQDSCWQVRILAVTRIGDKGSSPLKKTGKKGDIVPFGRSPPLNGSKGDIFCLITDKTA